MLQGSLTLAALLVLIGTILCGIAVGMSYWVRPAQWFVGCVGFLGATLIGVGVLLG